MVRDVRGRPAGVLVVLLVVALAIPGVKYQIWDGLPLDSVPRVLAAVVLAPFLLSSALRSAVDRLLSRVHQRGCTVAIGLGVGLIVIRVALLFGGGYEGFHNCYYPPVAPPIHAP